MKKALIETMGDYELPLVTMLGKDGRLVNLPKERADVKGQQ